MANAPGWFHFAIGPVTGPGRLCGLVGGPDGDTGCGANGPACGEMLRLVRMTGPAIIAIKCRVSTGAFVPGATSRSMRLLTAHPATRLECRFRDKPLSGIGPGIMASARYSQRSGSHRYPGLDATAR